MAKIGEPPGAAQNPDERESRGEWRRPSIWERSRSTARLFYRKVTNDGIFDKAGALAFQAVFSLIPMLALAYFIFALSGKFDEILAQVERFAASNLAPAVSDQLIGYLRTIKERVSPGAIGLFGVLGFLWAGISMISKAEQALNQIWGLRHTRSLRQRVWLYAVAVMVTPVVLGASLALTSFLVSQAGRYGGLERGAVWLLALTPLLLSAVFFSIVYWALPYTNVSRWAAIKAGVITAILLEALKQGFTFYAAWSVSNSVYGSLAALPILFLWLLLGAMVFLLGAELCYFFDSKEAGVLHVARTESRLSLPLLIDILRLHQRENIPVDHKAVVHDLNWDPSEVVQHEQYLVDIGLLRPVESSNLGNDRHVATESRFEPAFDLLRKRLKEVKYESPRTAPETSFTS